MGLDTQVADAKLFIDTTPIIYFVEKNATYINLIRPIFAGIDTGKNEAITSTITLLEVLDHPYRTGNTALAEKYREILMTSKGLSTMDISNEISEMAARLRAKYAIKSPDALQIATGLYYNADKFLTNDVRLRKVNEIEIVILDDFLPNETSKL